MKEYPSDQELVRQTRAGDLRAFEIIVERYQQAVYRIIYRLLRDWQEAEDVAQDAFLKCYQHLSQYDQARPFKPWLYRIATNLALSRLRRLKKHQLLSWDQFLNLNPFSRSEAGRNYTDPEAAWEEKEAKTEVALALKRLKPLDQLVIILRYLEELSYEEIALILQTNRNNVEVRLYRARQKLRALLEGKPGEERAVGGREQQKREVKTCSRAGK